MRFTTDTKRHMKRIKRLYKDAFPKEERVPFFALWHLAKKGEREFFAIESDSGKFGGFAVTMRQRDIVKMSYFAVHPKLRGRGIGSKALKALMKRFSAYRFILEIEDVDAPCDDRDTRLRRRKFYLSNGMKSAGFTVRAYGMDFEILTSGAPVTFEEYKALHRARRGGTAALNVTLNKYKDQ